MRKEPSRPILATVTCPVSKAPRIVSSSPARGTQGGQKGEGGGPGPEPFFPHPSWKEIVPDCSLAGEQPAQASSRISGMVGWVSSLWVGRRWSQAHAWESDQPVFKSWLCCGSLGKSSDLSELQSPVRNGGHQAPLKRFGEKRHDASQALGTMFGT